MRELVNRHPRLDSEKAAMDKTDSGHGKTWGGRDAKAKPKGLKRVWRGIRHSFTFHTPFPPEESGRVRKFWYMVFLSLFQTTLVITVLTIVDKQGWVDRSAWDSWGWSRTQSKTVRRHEVVNFEDMREAHQSNSRRHTARTRAASMLPTRGQTILPSPSQHSRTFRSPSLVS